MKRKDCAYCIDLDEQGALCDHPLRWDCGEPVEARCSSRCAYYERRMSVTEALSRIHNLEAKLAESEKYRTRYADMLIPIMAENAKLRDAMYTNAGRHALQHMDEDELRIWATQQSEYINQLEELVRDMWRFTGAACKKYPRLFDPAAAGGQTVQLNALDAIEQRMRELGIEDADA